MTPSEINCNLNGHKWMRVWDKKLLLKCFFCGKEEDCAQPISHSQARRLETQLTRNKQ